MTTIRESGFVLKIATGQAIGVTDQSVLEPAEMSSGSATAGQVLTADGVGGASWSTESGLGDVSGPASAVNNAAAVFDGTGGKTIKVPDAAVDFQGQNLTNLGTVAGHVPTSRQIIDGTGISGGGNLTADRTLSVNQSALDPANMSSGAATSGQLLTAGGGGATSWADPPASVTLPGSSTDDALTRWNGVGGDTLADSLVTLSDAGAMTFPAAGSISKPGAGAGSECFGAAAASAAANGVVVGPSANIYAVSSGDQTGAVCVGSGATIGKAIPTTGSGAAIAIGENAAVGGNCSDTICIGAGATTDDVCYGSVIIGQGADGKASYRSVLAGQLAEANGFGATAVGWQAQAKALGTAVGYDASETGGYGVAVGASSVSANGGLAFGYLAASGQDAALALGASASVPAPSSGTNEHAVAIGTSAQVGASGSAGAEAGVAIGNSASVAAGATHGIALGPSASVGTSSVDAISIGNGASASNANMVSVGPGAQGAGGNAVALGHDASSDGPNAVSIGNASAASETGGVAIGSNAKVHNTSTTSFGCVAIGTSAAISSAAGAASTHGIAIGQQASVAAGVADGAAYGYRASSQHSKSIAFGIDAATTAASRVTFGTIGGASDLELQCGLGLGVFGVAPPASQPSKINDPSGGATIDSESRTAIAAIIDVLEGAGLSSAT